MVIKCDALSFIEVMYMKILLAAIAVASMFVGPSAWGYDSWRGDVIVTAEHKSDMTPQERAAEIAERAGAIVLKVYASLSAAPGAPLMFRAASGSMSSSELVSAFSSDPEVLSVIEDIKVRSGVTVR